MRQAFKVAYLGSGFHGSQRQPGVRTVEGDLLEALRGEAILEDPRKARFQMASRTDRGVNALGNVVAFDASRDPREVLALINPLLEDIWLYAFATPGSEFRPRHARERWYRYFHPRPLDLRRLRAAARVLVGTHEFGGYARGGARGACTLRGLDVHGKSGWTVLDFRGDRFLWGMVRRLVAAMEAYERGEVTLGDLSRGLAGAPPPLRPADPASLCLMEVRHDVTWVPWRSQRALEAVVRRTVRTEVEVRVLQGLEEWVARSQPAEENASGKGL